MPNPSIETVGELLYWSYANLAMMANVLNDSCDQPSRTHFMIRSKLFSGLRKGTMNVGSFFDDEKLKGKLPQGCWYCGRITAVTMDHIIPRSKGGEDRGENLVFACSACNSSKGSKDFVAWMLGREQFPPLYLLRRYLKLLIEHCRENGLMNIKVTKAHDLSMPFDISCVPTSYPDASKLCKWVRPETA